MPSLSYKTVPHILSYMMLDNPVTRGMQTLYLPSVSTPLLQALQVFLWGKCVTFSRQLIVSVFTETTLCRFEPQL